MRKGYRKLFTHLVFPEPPDGLFEKIMRRIREEQRFLVLKRRFVIFSIGLAGSTAVFSFAFRIVQADIYESGFLHFLFLLFSDFEIVITYWKSFTMSLLETIPIMSLAIFFITVFVFLVSLKFWARDLKLIFTPKQLTTI